MRLRPNMESEARPGRLFGRQFVNQIEGLFQRGDGMTASPCDNLANNLPEPPDVFVFLGK